MAATLAMQDPLFVSVTKAYGLLLDLVEITHPILPLVATYRIFSPSCR
jgi:hypothetical protein